MDFLRYIWTCIGMDGLVLVYLDLLVLFGIV